MAPVFNGTAGNNYLRTTNLPSLNGVFTFTWWQNWNSTATLNTGVNIDGGTSSNYLYCQQFSATRFDMWWNNGGVGGNGILNGSFSTGVWYFFAVVVNGTNISGYSAPAGTNTLTLGSSNTMASNLTFSPANMLFGESVFTGEQMNGRMQNVKMWTAALSQAELEAELQTFRPRRWDQVHAWYPQLPNSAGERARDYSGNGFNMTEVGTITDFEPGPPLAWGSTDDLITLNPGTITQNSYRWRNDDGNEAAATWRQAQGVDDTIATLTNIRLRELLDAANDPTGKQFQLEYRKTDSLDWRKP